MTSKFLNTSISSHRMHSTITVISALCATSSSVVGRRSKMDISSTSKDDGTLADMFSGSI